MASTATAVGEEASASGPTLMQISKYRIADPQQCADRITWRMGKAVEAILAVGQELLATRAALPPNQWERMFKGHAQAIERPVPFSVRKAQMLMRIAANPVLAEAKHVSSLPASWPTLHELTKVDEPVLLEAIRDGRVHAEMQRKDVAALRGEPTESEPEAWEPFTALGDLERRLCKIEDEWPKTFHYLIAGKLRDHVQMIEAEAGGRRPAPLAPAPPAFPPAGTLTAEEWADLFDQTHNVLDVLWKHAQNMARWAAEDANAKDRDDVYLETFKAVRADSWDRMTVAIDYLKRLDPRQTPALTTDREDTVERVGEEVEVEA